MNFTICNHECQYTFLRKYEIQEIRIQLSLTYSLPYLQSVGNFFYENQSFFDYSSVLADLKAKYTKLEHCYLTRLADEYARDTVF